MNTTKSDILNQAHENIPNRGRFSDRNPDENSCS